MNNERHKANLFAPSDSCGASNLDKGTGRTRFADTPDVAEIVCCALDTANAVLSQRECARSSNRYQTLFGIDPDCQMHARILKANTTRHVSSMMAAITAAAWTAHTRKDG